MQVHRKTHEVVDSYTLEVTPREAAFLKAALEVLYQEPDRVRGADLSRLRDSLTNSLVHAHVSYHDEGIQVLHGRIESREGMSG